MSTQANSSPEGLSASFLPAVSAIGIGRFAVSRRIIKIAFAITLCSAGAFGVLSDSTYISSSNAVVSANVVEVRAPIDGTISGLPLIVGSMVKAGQIITRVDNPRNDRQHLDNLLTSETSSKSTLDALIAERRSLELQQKELLQRAKTDSSAIASRLEQQSRSAAKMASSMQFTLAEANIELHRGEQLHRAGIISDARLDTLRSVQLVASETLDAQLATLASLRGEAANAVLGILTEPGDASDVSYSRQRADEITIKLAENAVQLRVAREQSEEARMNVQAETVRENMMRQAEIHAPIQGLVWKQSATDGEHIVDGGSVLSLVDCSQQFVLVQVPQDRVPDVALHKVARVRLAGESIERPGTVSLISGDVLKLENTKFATVPSQDVSQQMATILVTLNATGGNTACLVGRGARVLIPTYPANLSFSWMRRFF